MLSTALHTTPDLDVTLSYVLFSPKFVLFGDGGLIELILVREANALTINSFLIELGKQEGIRMLSQSDDRRDRIGIGTKEGVNTVQVAEDIIHRLAEFNCKACLLAKE